MPKRKRISSFRPRKKFRRFRVRKLRGRRLRRALRNRKTRRVAKKLKSGVIYGPRIAPRSVLAKLYWQNTNGGAPNLYSSGAYAHNNNGILLDNVHPYHRIYNLSSIFSPDKENDNTGAGAKSVYNYAEFQPHFQKWLVRACKLWGWIYAVAENGSDTAKASPLYLWLWCDNNPSATTVDTADEAAIQPGVRRYTLMTNTYSPQLTHFKRYVKHSKVLKRRLDEDEDYGNMYPGTGSSAGSDPDENASVYLHFLITTTNDPLYDQETHVTWNLNFKMFTKLWDAPIDAMDTIDPKGET